MNVAHEHLLRYIRQLVPPLSSDPVTDADLLCRWIRHRDEDAFAALVIRHGPLVLQVSRRVVGDAHAAEDCAQAAFLVLARKAASIRPRGSVTAWLHSVARHVALRFRDAEDRRRSQEVKACGAVARATTADPLDELTGRELLALVDDEVERLPERYRLPVLLCCLEGRSQKEAARLLGWTPGSLRGRLMRGRARLQARLAQRGVAFPAVLLAAGAGEGAATAALPACMSTTARAAVAFASGASSAGHALPARAVLLAQAWLQPVTNTMKLALLGFVMLLGAGAGSAVYQELTAKPPEVPAALHEKAKATAEPTKPAAQQVRTDRHGDPLPEGAIARLGTVRWRQGLYVNALEYSPDGKKVAAVGFGRPITLWDAATGKEIHQFPNRGEPLAVAFSPDGTVFASTDSPTCHLWDVATGKELRQLKGHAKELRGVVFASDGKTLATAGGDETARIWDAKDGKELRRLDCKQGSLNAVVYSPDGKFLATAGNDGTIRLWDPVTGMASRQLTGHQKEVWKLVVSRDGTRLASSGADGTIRLWDAATARQRHVLGEKLGAYNLPIAFSPDGTLLAAGVDPDVIRLWDVASGVTRREWHSGAMNVRALAFSPDGKTVASGAAWEGIRLWDAVTGRERHPSEEHLGTVDFLRFSTDNTSLVSISREHRLVSWDLATQMPRRPFTWTARGISVTALSPNGDTLAIGNLTDSPGVSMVRLWDVRTGKPGRLLGNHQPRFRAMAFSPDGRYLAWQGSEGEDLVIRIWDVRGGAEVRRITGIANAVWCLCFSPDSKALACGLAAVAQGEPTLRLWDVSSGQEGRSFDCRVPRLSAIAFSPDGKVLATGDGDDGRRPGVVDLSVRLWDTATGRELSCHAGHSDGICAVAFSPDSKLVASATRGFHNTSVHVWEAATGHLTRRFEEKRSSVWSLAFAPDGLTVASGRSDSTILLWDITNRRAEGRWQRKALAPPLLDACWTALADADAAKAYDAVWMLSADPDQAIPLLEKQLQPVRPLDSKIVARLLADLDSDDFKVREKSTAELAQLGDAVAPALRRALASKPALETRRRVQQLLDRTTLWDAEALRDHRAIQVLEHIGTREARRLFASLARGAPEARRTKEAKASLDRLDRRPK